MPESNTRQPRPACLHSRGNVTRFQRLRCAEGSVQCSHYRGCTWKVGRKTRRQKVRWCLALPCRTLLPFVTPSVQKSQGPPASPLPLRAEVRFLFALTGTSGSDEVGVAATFFLPRARPFLDPSGTAFSSSSFTAGFGGFSAPPERRFEARVVTWMDRARA